MTTYADVITDALMTIGVLAETESASAEQGAIGLRYLNNMMGKWAGNSIDTGYVFTESPTDTLSLRFEYREPVTFNLAVTLAPVYGRKVDPVVAAIATTGYDKMLRDAINRNMQIASMYHLPLGAARTLYNITNDTP